METIKIKVNEKILDKVLSLLQQFDKEDLQVIEPEPDYGFSEPELKYEYQKLKSGNTKTFSLEEADEILEETIKRYEN
ncbi:hypothetical protein LZF95_12725 [Algoriphagus sp. AGSA1]|uniref:hypothetical protein n=1 Tax=Algoriphagus sp. AGSA1 TaxID=2907213 RepID=UPI001F460FE1|nr:hypothetical protein [Algoriphagus sp. AGSA1]MCE7055544.1 hypothetical protein [Algoriphagus sp. AGSA1]